MNDLISRNEVLEIAMKYCPDDDGSCSKADNDILDMLDEIEAISAADVQPVKHGQWETVSEYNGWGDTHYRCSVCGEEWHLDDGSPMQNNMNFCPKCGAKMDGGADNGNAED